MMVFKRFSGCGCVFLAGCLAGLQAVATSTFVNFETPPIHPVDMSPDGATLAVCNVADARLMLFDLTSGLPEETMTIPVGYDPVSVRFRTNTEVWVVNHVSDSVSVIDLNLGVVVATLETLDEPCDVVFAGTPQRAFVSCAQDNAVLVFDPADLGAAPITVPIAAEEPKALAVSLDGTKVYAAIFESGNSSTLIAGGAATGTIGFPPNSAMDDVNNPYGGVNPPPNDGANFNPPMTGGLPPAPRVGHIVKKDENGVWWDDNGADWTPWISGASAHLSGRYPGWDLVDRDVAVIDTDTLDVTYAERLMNINMALAVNPASGEITVVGTDATNEIRFEPVINGTFLRVNIGIVDSSDLSNTSVVDLNSGHLDYSTTTLPQSERDKSIGDPRAIVWNSAGTRAYISGMGSDNLVVIQSNGQRVTAGHTIEVGEGPMGMAIDEDRNQLYVLNRFDGSISVVDLGSELETARVPFFDPTPEAIKVGRKHLYNTRLTSGLGHVSCASCHVDARMDRLAWDLGEPNGEMKAVSGAGDPPQHNFGGNVPGLTSGFEAFHPMKGPMATQTLQDIIGKEPFHWRGDRDNLEEFNPAFMNLQGNDSMLSPAEMDEYKDFLATIHFPPNPFRNLDNSLPGALDMPGHTKEGRFGGLGDPLPVADTNVGLDLYRDKVRLLDANSFTCVVCHTLPLGSGTDTRFSGTLANPVFTPITPGPSGEHHLALVSNDGLTNKTMKIPQLRNMYKKVGFELTPGKESLAGFGYLHDGSIDTIARFVAEPVFTVQNDQEVADLTALMLAFSGSDFPVDPLEPPGVLARDAHAAVGKQSTLTSPAKDMALVSDLIDIADSGVIDLIAKSSNGAVERGWVYQTAGIWLPDSLNEPAITTAALAATASMSTPLTFTAVPAGLGIRLGIDRDEDLLPDYDEVLAGSSSTTSDTDGDGLTDYEEVVLYGTSPADPDTDGDGLTDFDEIIVHGTDPNEADTSDNGIPDGWLVLHGLDPLDPGVASEDADGDGYTNLEEYLAGSDPNDPDSTPPPGSAIPTVPPGAPVGGAAAIALVLGALGTLFVGRIRRSARP